MASINKVILIGNLGADPETRYTASGDAVTTLRIATTDNWKDKKSGERREATEWHQVVFYRKLAEIAGHYLQKGSQVYLEGRIKTRKWQDKEGQVRYTTEIEATEMQMLGQKQTTTPPATKMHDDEVRRGRMMSPDWMKEQSSSTKELLAQILDAKNESLEAMAQMDNSNDPIMIQRRRIALGTAGIEGGIRWAKSKADSE